MDTIKENASTIRFKLIISPELGFVVLAGVADPDPEVPTLHPAVIVAAPVLPVVVPPEFAVAVGAAAPPPSKLAAVIV
jgi:hypothetical protein